ncbi:hypothetical protein AAY84_13935 [Serratia marcescens]|uniref:hypothetical protein n=1 Tax=Serratia marcescens TaxID=615 RepID=UPI00062C9F88|nr:hypothetical protein [Serratia marcescens]EKN5095830.1 hypothetical protein [Yersinia enterocolitica]EKN5103299.1 hypothetical protein [Yersinia enterocolitica]KKZ17833.1 hypothetical protein AAY84_13935 [Serratia marcescens]
MDRAHTPFTSLSRRKRRAAALKIKTLIYHERDVWGGIFYDECDHGQSVASGNWIWSDIVFLGHDPAVFWNAEIIIANVAFADAVEEAAFDEAMSRLDTADQYQATHFNSSPNVDTNGKIISRTWLHKPELKYPQLDGMTFSNFVDKRAQAIARDNPPQVYLGYRILQGYAAGTGLRMIVEADVLNRSVIEAAISDFRARGECNWVSDVPAHVRYSDNIHCKPLNITNVSQ